MSSYRETDPTFASYGVAAGGLVTVRPRTTLSSLSPDGTALLEHGSFDGEGLDLIGDIVQVLPNS